MRYIFKDLMVTVLGDDAGAHCTGHHSVIACPLPTVACGPITCGITSVIPHVIETVRGAESLEVLRQELEYALGQISAVEQAAQSETQLSHAEAEAVAQKMTEALEELRKLKETLPPS